MKKSAYGNLLSLEEERNLVEDYSLRGVKVRELAETYEVSRSYAYKILLHHEIRKKSRRYKRPLAIEQAICRAYVSTSPTLAAVSVLYDVSKSYARAVLLRHGVVLNKTGIGVKRRITNNPIVKLWESGKSTKAISQIIKMPRYRVAHIIAKNFPNDERARKMVKALSAKIIGEDYKSVAAFARGLNRVDACSICAEKTKLHLDHCHSTGKVRGWLCVKCNTALGQLNDSISLMEGAIRYLRDANKKRAK